ncbi:hypothetical protein CZ794_04195 [Psychrobacter sp. JB385]|nr:hypothetical protein CZ794_04195 [Psychrobacter sp. JB385]
MHSIYFFRTLSAFIKQYNNKDSVNGKVMNGLSTTVDIS